MATASSSYRSAQRITTRLDRNQRHNEEAAAAANFTAEDRRVAKQLEASELLAEFLASEL